jgi:DNA-binding transcriptional LysR family regulator
MGLILQKRANTCFSRMEAVLGDILEDANRAQVAAIARRITRAQILALTAVHEFGSFAQAARHVNVSLTSLHRSARSLEKQVGRKLFMNTAQGVATNTAGARLSDELHLAVRELEWAEEEIRSQTGALRGRLLVGSLLLAGNNYISAGLDRFVAAHPEVSVRLVNGAYDELLTKLRGGAIDFLIGVVKNPPPIDDVVEETLGLDPYTIAVSRQHPLAGKRQVTLKDLRAGEWVTPGPGAQRRAVFESVFGNGPLPRYSVETHSLLTIFVLLAESNRMALMTVSELALNKRLGNQLTALDYPIDHAPAAIGVTLRKHWDATRLQQTFLGFLRNP